MTAVSICNLQSNIGQEIYTCDGNVKISLSSETSARNSDTDLGIFRLEKFLDFSGNIISLCVQHNTFFGLAHSTHFLV